MRENVQGKSGLFPWLNENFEKIFMVTGLLAIILFITWQVIYRYIITQFIERAGAAVWTEELSRYIFIWISYLALSAAIRKRSSIRVDILYGRLPERLQNISWIIVESLFLVLTGVMAMSMLTGCASISSRQVADELEGMLKAWPPWPPSSVPRHCPSNTWPRSASRPSTAFPSWPSPSSSRPGNTWARAA